MMTLATRLEKIESSGLIRIAQAEPELEYIFRHALVQDAAYESLLKADRRTLHQAVGQTLEGLYPDRLDDIAATLAFHFEKAEAYEKAVGYLVRAGECAARVYAVDESIALFRHALEIIPNSYPEEKLIHLFSKYGRSLELAGRFDAAIEVYEQMRAEGLKRKDLLMELDALMARAILHSTPSPRQNFIVATELCERALALARMLDNPEAQSRIYWILMLSTLFAGYIEESVKYGEQSLEIARTLDNPERLAFILNDMARTYNVSGMLEKARAVNREARTLWEKLGNLPMLVDNLGTQAYGLFFTGQFKEAIPIALEGYRIGKSIRNIWGQTFCLMLQCFCYTELGQFDQAIRVGDELLTFDPGQTFTIAQIATHSQFADIYAELGDPATSYHHSLAAVEQAGDLDEGQRVVAFAGLARYELRRGNFREAQDLLEKALQNYNPQNFVTFIPQYVEDARNDLLLHKGEYSAALEALDTILEVIDRLGIIFCRPELMLRKARTLVALGREAEALPVLATAVAACRDNEARRHVWKMYALISKLQAAQGQPAEAQQSLEAAREEIRFLESHCPPGLRAAFLQLPEVRAVLEAK